MLQHLVIARPVLAPQDRRRIEALRARHDPQHALIGPHVTLVFPVSGLPAAEIDSHVSEVAETSSAIRFHINAAAALHDRLTPNSYVFLLPETGAAELTLLHDRLYDGPLRRHLRWDIPFTPHMTVGRFEEPMAADDLATELNAKRLSFSGRIEALDLIAYDGLRVDYLARFPLATPDREMAGFRTAASPLPV